MPNRHALPFRRDKELKVEPIETKRLQPLTIDKPTPPQLLSGFIKSFHEPMHELMNREFARKVVFITKYSCDFE